MPGTTEHLKSAIRRPLATRVVLVEEWNAQVTVRELTGVERAKVEDAARGARAARLSDDEIGVRVMATAIRWSVVDPATGAQVFDDGDIATLSAGPAAPLQTLWPEIDRLSRLSPRKSAAEKKS